MRDMIFDDFLASRLTLVFYLLLRGQIVRLDHVVAEYLDRAGHLADFVLTLHAGNINFRFATRKRPHDGGHVDHRIGDAPSDH